MAVVGKLDNAQQIPECGEGYSRRWPCRDCGQAATHAACRCSLLGHTWLCRDCAASDVEVGITVFRLRFIGDVGEVIPAALSRIVD